MKNFFKTITELLNDKVCRLRDQVRHLVQFYEDLLGMNIAPHGKNDKNNYNTIADIDYLYSFITYFMYIYNKNPQFKNSLLVRFIKAAVAKMSGMENLRYDQNVVKFYSMLEATSRKGFEAISLNLMGTCFCHM